MTERTYTIKFPAGISSKDLLTEARKELGMKRQVFGRMGINEEKQRRIDRTEAMLLVFQQMVEQDAPSDEPDMFGDIK